MPSENGSMLSTSSSSAFPPRVIIYRRIIRIQWHRCNECAPNLIHLFQLEGYQVETSHELVQPPFSEIVIPLFLRISGFCYLLKVFGTSQKLFFAFLVVFQDAKVRFGIFYFFWMLSVRVENQGNGQTYRPDTQSLRPGRAS